MQQKLIFTNSVAEELTRLIAELRPNKTFFLSDSNTRTIAEGLAGSGDMIITIPAGDDNKNPDSLQRVWEAMSNSGGTRRSLLVNVGGGMVTDLGGFAAATFKRGIRFINVATTLLGAVDASVGGKTGINFMHYKNEIGAFAPADAVIISTVCFATLPPRELRSGFAEMLKHGLISSADTYRRLLNFDIVGVDLDELLPLLEENVLVKRKIVEEDPREQGIRKALNLGHTAGHALESLAMEREHPVAHGYAVAHGLLVEMILSHMLEGFPSGELYPYASLLKEAYADFPAVRCDDYCRILELMSHDKKNPAPDSINYTLLKSPGNPVIDRIVAPDDIKNALDIYRDLI